jgi:hypothetical protein
MDDYFRGAHRNQFFRSDTRIRYALQWVDRHDGAPRSNGWKVFQTTAQAEAVVEKVPTKLLAEKRRKNNGRSQTVPLKVAA